MRYFKIYGSLKRINSKNQIQYYSYLDNVWKKSYHTLGEFSNRKSMTLKEATKHALTILKQVMEEKLNSTNIEV